MIIICLEKRSYEAMEGYVLEISNLKRSKSESKTEYFNMIVQTEKGTMRAVCFSPDKWKRLHQFQRDNRSCVISNVVRTKPTEVKLTNHSTVKGKTLMFSKDNTQKITTIDQIINECEPYDFANVKIKVVKEGEIKDKNGLKLKEFTVTDDGETLIQLTLFQDLIESVVEKCDYIISNVQVVTFQNRKKLRSSHMTKVSQAEHANIPNVEFDSDSELEVAEEENIIFDNIQEEGLKEQLSCNKCNSTIVKTEEKIVKFSSCSSIQLAVRCHRKLSSNLCPVEVLANAVLTDVKIGNNEEFIMFVLSNNFNLKHINQNINDINLCN